MLNLERAPQTGTMYAVFTDKVLYGKYSRESLAGKLPEDPREREMLSDRLLELHLFDGEKEYRCIRTRMHGLREYEITDACEHDDVYEERVYVSGSSVDRQENLRERAAVVNYIVYDENDLLHIVNYRLKEVEE